MYGQMQAGNMAHLLNHSCEPNCYSRLTDVWDEAAGRAEQHVILYAKRDIAALEELTYDYRCYPLLTCSSPAVCRTAALAGAY